MKLLKLFFITGAINLLTGCQSPLTDMDNNNFISITPETPPKNLLGLWSGNMGPYLVTFQWTEKGTGIFCSSYGTGNMLQKVKFSKNNIEIQDGTRLEIKDLSSIMMLVHSPYYMGNETKLYKDTSLENSSLFCAKELAQN